MTWNGRKYAQGNEAREWITRSREGLALVEKLIDEYKLEHPGCDNWEAWNWAVKEAGKRLNEKSK